MPTAETFKRHHGYLSRDTRSWRDYLRNTRF